MRFAFPESERSNVIINFPRHGGTVEIVGDAKVRGVSEQSRATDGAYFVAEFSKPFSALGTFRKDPGEHEGWGIGNSDVDPGQRQVSGSYAGSYVTFKTTARSEEHTSELQSLMRISYAVCCLKKKQYINI